ncbi:MAG: S41 family peptidase [Imperialibacter sp.]|uniref:S41 family peptidase n=1 Tax=Imperialibacter sp. TaxID=2038411 RepID=UPI0032EEB934
MKQRIIRGSLLMLVIGGVFSLSFTEPDDKYFQIAKSLDIFATLFKEVNTYYVDEVSPDDMVKSGINAMLSSLDPYTDFISEDEYDDFRTITTGQYGGIGALVGKRDGYSTIIMPFKDFPAYRAGLQIGDKVTKIDGKDIVGKYSDNISDLLKGPVNTPIVLTIERYGVEKAFDVPLVREKITINNVPFYGLFQSDIGYIRLSDFTTDAGKEVRNALADLKKQGAKYIVLDLRGNPGGLLDEAINVSNVFVKKGSEIVTTKGKVKDWNKTYKAYQDPVDTEIPLAVLVNGGSASAAEIVAGVIQDYDRGVLVGRRTFGKGLVQATRPLAYNSQLKITTAKYYIPSGRCIQAIDYAHRNPDGSVAKIPDSLMVAFKTSKGRVVFDGGGVNPDITAEVIEYAPVTLGLVNGNHVFDYATKYHFEHKTIPSPAVFKLSEEEFASFKSWLAKRDLKYSSAMERSLDGFEASAKKEQYLTPLENEIQQLRNQLNKMKNSDLEHFKDEIKEVLEEEILSRYYFEAGIIESSFSYDPDILEAVKLFRAAGRYSELLNPTN